jgi:hypothetical protein
VFERNILRNIFRSTKEDDGVWRVKMKRELGELIKQRNVTNCVECQRLSWFGHTNRMPETSFVRKIYRWKPFASRPVGRLKYRCEDDVRNGLKKMKIIKWAEQVKNRLKLEVVVEKDRNV